MTRGWIKQGVLAALAGGLLGGLPWSAWVEAQSTQPVKFQVGFSLDPEARAPLTVAFTAQAPAEYRVEWTFGDGGTGQGNRTEHTFYRAGTYTVQARLFDARGELRSTASGPLTVRSGGPERAQVVVLLGRGEVRLSAAGSVAYRPGTPSFTLDGRAVGTGPLPLAPGEHRATVRLPGEGGVLERSVVFRAAALPGSVPFETEVLRLTNRARASGWNCATRRPDGPALAPLTPHPELEVAALAQSAGMALHGYFDHQSGLDGSTPAQRVQASGLSVRGSAENIAGGQPTPEAVVDAWLRSPGHCRSIMGDFTRIGVSYVHRPEAPYRHYWTQVFATPAD